MIPTPSPLQTCDSARVFLRRAVGSKQYDTPADFPIVRNVAQRGELQKKPLAAKSTWRDHSIPSRWVEKADRRIHPHAKPIGLIERLIAAVTLPGDLVIDPAAGGFGVLHATFRLDREFIGCDAAFNGVAP